MEDLNESKLIGPAISSVPKPAPIISMAATFGLL